MKTAPAWWPSKTTRALIQGKYSRLYPPRSDHVEAAIEGLEMFKKALRGGKPPEEVGPALELFARLLSRRT